MKKKTRICLYILLLSGIFFLSAYPAEAETTGIKQQFEQKISEILGVSVSVEDYKLEYTTIQLKNVRIGAPTDPERPFGKIESLSATCDFMSLLGGSLILNDVDLNSAQINLTRNPDGRFFPESPDKNASFSKELSIDDLPFLNLKAKDLKISIKEPISGQLFNVAMSEFALKRTKGESKMNLKFESSANASAKDSGRNAEARVSGNIDLQGDFFKPSANGTFKISELKLGQLFLKQPFTLSKGIFTLKENTIQTENLSGTWGRSKIRLSGHIVANDNFNFIFDYSINPIILEELSQAFISGNGLNFGGSGSASGRIKGTFANFQLTGQLTWPSFRISAPISNSNSERFVFPFKNVSGNYTYDGRKISITSAEAGIFGGKISGTGSIDTHSSPIRFSLSARGRDLRTEQFLGENSSQKNVVSGPANMIFNSSGDSSGLASMYGSGNFDMKNGRYQAPPVVTPLLAMVNLKEFSSGEIQSGNGTFNLIKGILNTDDLVFLTSAGKAFYRGQVGLDTTLNGKLNLIFAPEAVAKSRVLQQISLDGKTAGIPTRVEGTLLSPVFPGFSAEKLLELGLKRTGQKILIDILSPRKKQPDQPQEKEQTDSKEKPAKKILKDLQKIFKF